LPDTIRGVVGKQFPAIADDPEANGGVLAPLAADRKLHFWITLQEETTMAPLLTTIEDGITTWSGIVPPNDPARRLAADLASTIAAFEALRGTLRFEDEPSSFEAALLATKDSPV
jgi:hypothetical protein